MPLDKDVLILYWSNANCNADWKVLQGALTSFTSVYDLEFLGRKAIQISVEAAVPQRLLRISPMKYAEIVAVRLRETLPSWKEQYLERKIFYTGTTQGCACFYSDDFVYQVELGKFKEVK